MEGEGEATVWSEGLDEAEVVGVSAAELSALAHFSLQRRVWRLRFEDTLKRRRQISHAQARTTDYTFTASSKRDCRTFFTRVDQHMLSSVWVSVVLDS